MRSNSQSRRSEEEGRLREQQDLNGLQDGLNRAAAYLSKRMKNRGPAEKAHDLEHKKQVNALAARSKESAFGDRVHYEKTATGFSLLPGTLKKRASRQKKAVTFENLPGLTLNINSPASAATTPPPVDDRQKTVLTIDQPALSERNTHRGKRGRSEWTDYEKEECAKAMRWVLEKHPTCKTLQRWRLVSDRLCSNSGISRTWASVKDQWNRYLRYEYNIDERHKANPARLMTSLQNGPRKRRFEEMEKCGEASKRSDTADANGGESNGEPRG